MLNHHPDLETLLDEAELRYVQPGMTGYRRERQGEEFIYLNTKGEPLRDTRILEWITSLRIPPAWEEVWICPKRNGHLLATGRDAKGRKQYIYHPRWHALTSQQKFGSLLEFGAALPHLRETVAAHLRAPDLSKQKVLALVVTLLERTLIRIGNNEYARGNDSYGLTTLHDEHVAVSGTAITFDFIGKSGKEHAITLKDKRLAKLVKSCRDLPGHELFQYKDASGTRQSLNSFDVNAYLYEITGLPFTAKIFRTWGGSVCMADLLCNMPPEDTKKAREQQTREAIRQVSEMLGNTVAVCRKYYVHPVIVELHMEDALSPFCDPDYTPDSPYALKAEEVTLMRLLESVENK